MSSRSGSSGLPSSAACTCSCSGSPGCCSGIFGPQPGTVFGLDAVATIGRDVNNSIVVEDEFASTEHATLTFRGRAWYVEDLGSTNGTFVNGLRIEGLRAIGYGDELQVGRVRFRFERVRR